jgi:ribosome-associated protein
MDIRKLQRAIVDGLEDVKAQNIQVFNTEQLSPLFERVIVASGQSNRQTKALAASVRDAVKSRGMSVLRTEGEDNGEWIIVDCGAAVAHIMQPSIRDYYRLEEIWGGKPVHMKLGETRRGLVKAAGDADDEDDELPRRASAPAGAPSKPVAGTSAKRGAGPGAAPAREGAAAKKSPARGGGSAAKTAASRHAKTPSAAKQATPAAKNVPQKSGAAKKGTPSSKKVAPGAKKAAPGARTLAPAPAKKSASARFAPGKKTTGPGAKRPAAGARSAPAKKVAATAGGSRGAPAKKPAARKAEGGSGAARKTTARRK